MSPGATVAAEVEAVSAFSTATLLESGATVVDPALRPLDVTSTLCGRAFTVRLTEGHNIWLHRAVYEASEGDVLVASVEQVRTGFDYGYWGEILGSAAHEQGLLGLVIDGSVRDRTELVELGFPVFARGLCVRGTAKDPQGGGTGGPVTVGGVEIRTGDVIVGDADGVVAVPRAQAALIGERAALRVDSENQILKRIAAGESTLDIYGFR
jgi:4-hydroxy-4-methyl-2-oxoglutarate aldolase